MLPTEGLQFQTAEFSGRNCTFCKSVIGATYFQIQGRDSCPNCARSRLAGQNATDSGGKMMMALLWGCGAAVLGSLAYALTIYIGFQLGILAIGIGWLVGTAIKRGTEGHTSRKYQIIAVVLTYLSIATSYIPVVLVRMAEKGKVTKIAAADKPPVVKTTEAPVYPKRITPGAAILALAMAAPLLLALPLVGAFSNMPGGLITLFIIFLGLQQAWKHTAPDVALVAGPYPNTAT